MYFIVLFLFLFISIVFNYHLIKSEAFQSEFCISNIGHCYDYEKHDGLDISKEDEKIHLEKLRIRENPLEYLRKRHFY